MIGKLLYTRRTAEITSQAELSRGVIKHKSLITLSKLIYVLIRVSYQVQSATRYLLYKEYYLILDLV